MKSQMDLYKRYAMLCHVRNSALLLSYELRDWSGHYSGIENDDISKVQESVLILGIDLCKPYAMLFDFTHVQCKK